ncbi:MAG: hypothetical protein GYA16_13950 [Spirochaetes bacterium]|nr:hypothetical protein [Spirochaetota bacterium]
MCKRLYYPGGDAMAITKEVIDEFMKNYKGPEDITGSDGLLKQGSVQYLSHI